MLSIFGAVFLHEWDSLKIRGNFFSRRPPPVFQKFTPFVGKKGPLSWAEGACPPMSQIDVKNMKLSGSTLITAYIDVYVMPKVFGH